VFSARTSWIASPNLLAQAVARRRAARQPLLDLTESNPTRVGLGLPPDELAQALANPHSAGYDPHPLGLPEARAAICGYYRSRSIPADPDRMVVTASTSEAYAFLFKLLADPGDEVLVPQPSYPLFEYLAGLESVRTVGYPLRYDGEWHLDAQAIRSALSSRARALVVVSPNNPTGSFLKKDELERLVEICDSRGLALLSDEVFADFPFGPDEQRVESVLTSSKVLSFALSGLSKIAALPQLKIGWLVASGPDEEVSRAMQRLEIIADAYLSPNTPAQLALARVLERRHLVQSSIRERLRANWDALRALHSPEAAWQPLRVEGGWSAILRIPAIRSEQEWAVGLVEQDGVLVHPGFFFDFPSEAYLAVSLIVEPEVFREGLQKIDRRIARS
jgi:aspartate/methionine/tyrosine aminotransferase